MQDFNWSWGQPKTEEDWRKEGLYWQRKYLAMRQRVKHLTKINRQSRKLIVRLLQEK